LKPFNARLLRRAAACREDSDSWRTDLQFWACSERHSSPVRCSDQQWLSTMRGCDTNTGLGWNRFGPWSPSSAR